MEDNDPILDACLAEVLGGHAPPDLTQRILRAHAQAKAAAGKQPMQAKQSELSLAADALAISPRPQADKKASRFGIYWSAAAIVGTAAALIGVVVLVSNAGRSKGPLEPIAAGPKAVPPAKAAPNPQVVQATPTVETTPNAPAVVEPAPEPISPPPAAVVTAPPPEPKAAPQPAGPTVIKPRIIAASGRKLNRERSADTAIISFVNEHFAQTWKEAGVRPTPAVADAEWCQRVFARVLGRAPTAAELKSLADDKSEDRREKLARRLLTDTAYTVEFANHWSAILTQIFVGRGSSSPNAPSSRDDLQKYFAFALTENKSYSRMATDLLTATGASRPGTDDYNPAVNFLLDGLTADAVMPTARVGRVLLGHQLQCAQCHDDRTQGWTQDQFWSLNAALRQVRVNRRDGLSRLVAVRRIADATVSFDAPDGQGRKASPHFIDGTDLTAGASSGTDLLQNLAKSVTNSDDFCRAAVNRVWAQIFDYGFTRPVDDLGPKSKPAEREVFDRLAGEFAGHDFDLRQLIQWSVLSEPFARSSKLTDLASKDLPETGETPLFSRFYSRPARSTDAFSLVSQASRTRTAGGSERDIAKARTDFLTQANRNSTKVVAKKVTSNSSTNIVVSKSDEILQRAITVDPAGLVKKMAANKMSYDHKVEHLMLAVTGRKPTTRELRAANDLLRAAGDRQPVALEDLWWSLQNSSDSIFDR
jgi:hypothetical protein